MTRKLFWIGLSYLFGIFLATIGWGQNNYTFSVMAIGLGVLCFFALKQYREYVVTMTLSFLIGIGVNSIYTHNVYDKLIEYDGKSVTINGYVYDYSYIGSDTCFLTIKGEIDGVSANVAFYVDNDDYDYYDKISVTGKVYKISDSINYTSESYSRPKNIFLQGKTANKVVLDNKNVNPFLCAVKHYRNYLVQKLDDIVGGEEGAFLTAMLCGDKSEMSQPLKTTMYRSVIGHLFAVSGTHLVIVTALFSAVLLRFVKWKKLNFILVMCEVWGFAVFAGLSVSVVRSAIMLTFLQGSFFFGRKSDPANTLGLCVLILTAFSPYTAKDPSFLMSVIAVFAVNVVAPKVISSSKDIKITGKTSRLVVSVIVILLFTLPLNLFFFDGVSVISPISNLIIVPFATAALQTAFVVVISGGLNILAVPFLTVSKYLVKIVLYLAKLFSKIPYSYITTSSRVLSVIMLLTCLIPIFYVLYKKNLKKGTILTAVIFFLWVCTYNLAGLFDNATKIAVLSGTYGTDYVVYKGSTCFVVESGCKGKNDKGLERFICDKGISKINFVIITNETYYTMSKINDDLSVKPDKFFLKTDDADTDNSYFIGVGDTLDFNDVSIEIKENSVDVKDDKSIIILEDKQFTLSDKTFDLSDETYPLLINTDKNTTKRLNYNFN